MPVSRLGGTRRIVQYGAFIVSLLVVIEITSYVGIAIANGVLDEPVVRRRAILNRQSELIHRLLAQENELRDVVDSTLGWRYRAGYDNPNDRITLQGLRGEHVYGPHAPPGVIRVAAFGDSFVYGSEVSHRDAWPAQLEAIAPDLEILNYGVGGYGTDQALLRYRQQGTALDPQLVVMGYANADIGRVVNVYRRFLSVREGLAVKPRFALGPDGDLQLVPSPIPRAGAWRPYLEAPELVRDFGELDYWYQPVVYEHPLYDYFATLRLATAVWVRVRRRYFDPNRLLRGGVYNTKAEAFRVQTALFDRFVSAVLAAGATPVIVFLPDGPMIENASRGEGATAAYQPLIDHVEARGYAYLDALEAFRVDSPPSDLSEWFSPGGHYSPSGNRRVAEYLAGHLRQLGRATGERASP